MCLEPVGRPAIQDHLDRGVADGGDSRGVDQPPAAVIVRRIAARHATRQTPPFRPVLALAAYNADTGDLRRLSDDAVVGATIPVPIYGGTTKLVETLTHCGRPA